MNEMPRVAVILRFWRKPMPHSNSYPNITFVVIPGDTPGASFHGKIQDGHTMTLDQIKKYMSEQWNIEVKHIMQPLPAIEVTINQFVEI